MVKGCSGKYLQYREPETRQPRRDTHQLLRRVFAPLEFGRGVGLKTTEPISEGLKAQIPRVASKLNAIIATV